MGLNIIFKYQEKEGGAEMWIIKMIFMEAKINQELVV